MRYRHSHSALHLIGFQNYSKVTYSVDSFNLEYLCSRWSDSHRVFSIEFGTKKLTTPQFLDSKTNSENPVKLSCIDLEKSAWKSVYTIIDFTVNVMGQATTYCGHSFIFY